MIEFNLMPQIEHYETQPYDTNLNGIQQNSSKHSGYRKTLSIMTPRKKV